MRRLATMLVVLLLLPLVGTVGQGNNFRWDFDTVDDPLCSPSLKDDCVQEFELQYTVGTNSVVAAVVPTSVCTLSSGTVFTCTAPRPKVIRYANADWIVRAVGVSAGARQESLDSNVVTVPGRRPIQPAGLRSQ